MQRKTMYDMDEKELGAFIAQQEHLVAKLSHESPGSAEHDFEAGVLEDARQLLAEKRKKKQ
jgi:uracil DNA glycosylase